jgi:hypothetical protein
LHSKSLQKKFPPKAQKLIFKLQVSLPCWTSIWASH